MSFPLTFLFYYAIYQQLENVQIITLCVKNKFDAMLAQMILIQTVAQYFKYHSLSLIPNGGLWIYD
jgi:hypothetical protein